MIFILQCLAFSTNDGKNKLKTLSRTFLSDLGINLILFCLPPLTFLHSDSDQISEDFYFRKINQGDKISLLQTGKMLVRKRCRAKYQQNAQPLEWWYFSLSFVEILLKRDWVDKKTANRRMDKQKDDSCLQAKKINTIKVTEVVSERKVALKVYKTRELTSNQQGNIKKWLTCAE